MNDNEKAEQIITALRKLDNDAQALYLFSLLGVDSPRSIVDAARWSCIESLQKTQKALDASA